MMNSCDTPIERAFSVMQDADVSNITKDIANFGMSSSSQELKVMLPSSGRFLPGLAPLPRLGSGVLLMLIEGWRYSQLWRSSGKAAFRILENSASKWN